MEQVVLAVSSCLSFGYLEWYRIAIAAPQRVSGKEILVTPILAGCLCPVKILLSPSLCLFWLFSDFISKTARRHLCCHK